MAKIINPLRVDSATGTITIMTKPFAVQAYRYGTPEYKMLQEVKRDYPDFRVKVRQIKTNPAQRRYANLTYDRMREYVETHDPDGLADFDRMIEHSEFRSVATRYPSVKKEFLDRYPEVKTLWANTPAETKADDSAPSVETDTPNLNIVEPLPAAEPLLDLDKVS